MLAKPTNRTKCYVKQKGGKCAIILHRYIKPSAIRRVESFRFLPKDVEKAQNALKM